jgi:hypothetical protein
LVFGGNAKYFGLDFVTNLFGYEVADSFCVFGLVNIVSLGEKV